MTTNMKTFLKLLFLSAFLAAPLHAEFWSVEDRVKDNLNKVTLGAHNIDIQYYSGMITLSGEVASEADRIKVEETAAATRGVKQIRNNLRVTHVGAGIPSALTEAANNRIKNLDGLDRYDVTVEDRNGTIMIMGFAANERDRGRIVQTVRNTPGIRDVEDRMVISQGPTDAEIERNVLRTLSAESDINLSGVSFTSTNGIVTFRGAKNNHREIDHILSVALMSDGVKDVKSEMVIRR